MSQTNKKKSTAPSKWNRVLWPQSLLTSLDILQKGSQRCYSKTGKNYQNKTKERSKECIDGIKYSTRQKVKSASTDTYNYFCPLEKKKA